MDGYVDPLIPDVVLTNRHSKTKAKKQMSSMNILPSHELRFKKKMSRVYQGMFGHTFSFASSPKQNKAQS